VGLDGWNEQLASVEDAEAALQRGSDSHNKLEARKRLGQLVEDGQILQDTLRDLHQTLKDNIEYQMSREMGNECGECLKHLYKIGPREQMNTIQGKNDRLLLCIGSIQGLPDCWDPCIKILNAQETITGLIVTRNGRYSAEATSFVQLCGADLGIYIQGFGTKDGYGFCMAFSPDDETRAVGWWGKVRLFSIAAGSCTGTFHYPGTNFPTIRFSPDGNTFV
jgi:hypothetical protein